MAKYRVDISEPAENDLRDIVRYISVLLSALTTALKMMDAIGIKYSDVALPSGAVFIRRIY